MFSMCSSSPRRRHNLRAIDEAGLNVRAWCFACARGDEVDAIIWMLFQKRGWPDELPEAARKFRCKGCRSSANVVLFPASRPKEPKRTWAAQVEHWFHNERGKGRRLVPVPTRKPRR